jgi:histidinol-phosphate aminotransferase
MRFVLFSPMFLACEARLRLMGANYTVFPLDERFRIRERDWEQLTANDFIIMDCPKNPTGSLLHDDDLERLSHVCGKLLVDEAYVEFSARQSFAPRASERFFVFRSLSKAYGLAGQRLGFLVADEPTATAITKRQWFCNIDHLSLALLDVILGEPFVAERTACIVRDRELVTTELRALGFEVLPSQANFILLRTPEASRLVAGLRDQGILVLDTGLFGYTGHIRISIGTPQQNQELISALCKLRNMNDGGANSV